MLVVGLVIGILTTAVWVRDTIREQDAQKAAAAAGTVYPVPGECTLAELAATVDAPVHAPVGAGLTARLTVRNLGSEPCVLDVGGEHLGLVLTSGSHTMLDSLVCPAEPASRRLLVDTGQEAAVDVTWNGMIASSTCLGAAGPAGGPGASAPASPEAAAAADADGNASTADGAVDDAMADAASGDPGADGTDGQAGQAGSEAAGEGGQQDEQDPGQAAGQAEAAPAAQPAGAAASGQTTDENVTQVSVQGGGGYAQSGTYTLTLTLGGQRVGGDRPLVIGRG